jgi:hypothetical protein
MTSGDQMFLFVCLFPLGCAANTIHDNTSLIFTLARDKMQMSLRIPLFLYHADHLRGL